MKKSVNKYCKIFIYYCIAEILNIAHRELRKHVYKVARFWIGVDLNVLVCNPQMSEVNFNCFFLYLRLTSADSVFAH